MAKAPTEVIDTLDLAMLRVQAALQPPPLDQINPHFKIPYTSFQAAREAIVPLCAANDISVTQDVTTVIDARGCFASVVTVLTHASGQQRMYGPLLIPAQSQTAQHVAGAVTYGRRIGLLAWYFLQMSPRKNSSPPLSTQRPGNGVV